LDARPASVCYFIIVVVFVQLQLEWEQDACRKVCNCSNVACPFWLLLVFMLLLVHVAHYAHVFQSYTTTGENAAPGVRGSYGAPKGMQMPPQQVPQEM
jgi:hypothetical protein